MLRERFPKAFNRQRQPLKLGVDHDIATALPNLGRIEIAGALGYYTSNIHYLRSCVENAPRINLDGHSVGIVTKDEAEFSGRKLAAIRAKMAQRREHHAAPPPPKPKLSLADLKVAAVRRKLTTQQA